MEKETKAFERICESCHESLPPDCTGPDACIGYLPGVWNACCGHGDPAGAYIIFGFSRSDHRNYTSGKKAIEIMDAMRKALGSLSDEAWHGGHDRK